MAAHLLGQMCPCQVLQEKHLDPCFLGSVPQKVCPWTLEDPLS